MLLLLLLLWCRPPGLHETMLRPIASQTRQMPARIFSLDCGASLPPGLHAAVVIIVVQASRPARNYAAPHRLANKADARPHLFASLWCRPPPGLHAAAVVIIVVQASRPARNYAAP